MSRRARTDNNTAEFRRSEAHLDRAFELARMFRPHPNPRVGAVVVTADGEVVGEGAHRRAGELHAEVLALHTAGARAAGSTVYVSLEPCAHHGRTPPCANALVSAGVGRVVVGVVDPDPRVAGAGIAALRDAGIEVIVDADPERAEAIDPGYFHHRRTGRPLIVLKLAATLDGQAAAADGTSQWITSEESRAGAHHLRAASDAVVVGAGTLRADDPLLDVRVDGFSGRQPRPVIVAGEKPLPPQAKVYGRDPLVYTPVVRGDEPRGLEIDPLGGDGVVDLIAAVKDMGARGLLDVMVEGGPTLASSFLRAGLVDRVVLYLGAKLAGGVGLPALGGTWGTLGDAIDLTVESVGQIGADVVVTARVGG